ncbi:metal-sensitive transcriptional regulator [Nafulsella turpanensis]|uniref:metal-sensitive transcriptional regulator n=1 Tax=Nafulsella turpanensis TaxID=1265690 RepID=UPI0003801A2E|nr:metal-sensitive transcriptional regulator [Nafulsella turpanensis]
MLPKDLTRDLKTRLKSISGQIEGIVKMLDEERSPKDILLQFRSVKSGLNKAEQLLLDEVFRKTLAIQIVKAMDACPGDCGNEERFEAFRQQFPDLKLEELAEKMEEINSLHQWLQEYLKEQKKD